MRRRVSAASSPTKRTPGGQQDHRPVLRYDGVGECVHFGDGGDGPFFRGAEGTP